MGCEVVIVSSGGGCRWHEKARPEIQARDIRLETGCCSYWTEQALCGHTKKLLLDMDISGTILLTREDFSERKKIHQPKNTIITYCLMELFLY